MVLTPLQKLTKNGEDWGKLIFAKGFKKFLKVQNIAQSDHTATEVCAYQCDQIRLHSPLWQKFKKLWQKIQGLVSILQKLGPTLAKI